MDKPSEKAYWERKFAGMRRIEQMEIERARRLTLSQKFDEFAALFEFARNLPVSAAEQREIEEVRQRWSRIKGASKKK